MILTKIDYSTVYGRFYQGTSPVTGTAVFVPRRRIIRLDGNVLALKTLIFTIEEGVLLGDGTPGASIPASASGLYWDVRVTPLGYSNMIQSYPGDTLSLGD